MTTKKKDRSHTLSIFLLKPNVRKAGEGLNGERTLHEQRFQLADKIKVELYTRRTVAAAPRWAKFFDQSKADLQSLGTRSASGLLFVPCNNRLFALAFGHGRFDLKPGCWEDSFGLRVTASLIDEKKIRSIDSKTFEAIARHTRTQTSHEGETFSFGLDPERDLLRALTGAPRDQDLGTRLSGLDALVATVRTEIDDLPTLLGRYLTAFKSKAYQTHFAWIDHVAEVREPAVLDAANGALEEALQTWKDGSSEKIWLVPPELVDWSSAGEFSYGESSADRYPDLHLKEFLPTIPHQSNLTIKTLKTKKVLLRDANDEVRLASWPAYKCLYAELDINGGTYLLTAGHWYRVEANFANRVKKEVSAIVATTPKLPDYKEKTEGEYNERVSKEMASPYALMDKKNISFGGGGSRFEFCDLLSKQRDMIHVKRYGGSAPLSHLFAQGANAAQLWMSDGEFRMAANKVLPKELRLSDPSKRPENDEYRVVYAIISNSKKPIDESLPFFSCLTLRNAAQAIRGLGMKVSVVKVQA